MGLLRLAVFGPPEVFHDECRLSFALRKAEALLLYLAVEGGMHSRSKLAALLWPDSEPSTARNALRNALTLLRNLLADAPAAGHSHLLLEPELLGLNPQAPLERDLDVVQRAWKAAQRLAAAPSEEQREALITTVQHALSLVRGPFLDGFWLREDTGFDEWHEQQQQQWQVRVQLLLERLSAWQEDGFELEAAKVTLTRWLGLDPLSEEASRRLMRVHLAQGDPTAALQVYAILRARLAQELHVKPSAETVALAERIRVTQARRGTAPALPSPTVVSQLPGELVAPLVGRAAAFRQLVGRYQQAQQGQPQAVLLVGEAGIGKTRLASEFVAWAWAQGPRCSVGTPSNWEAACPIKRWSRRCESGWKQKTRRRICWRTCGWRNCHVCCPSCACAIPICRPPCRMSSLASCGCLKRRRASWMHWLGALPWSCCSMICNG